VPVNSDTRRQFDTEDHMSLPRAQTRDGLSIDCVLVVVLITLALLRSPLGVN
jgi:hypothetical protein